VPLEVEEDCLQELPWNALALGQVRHEHGTTADFFGQRQESLDAVLGFSGQHGSIRGGERIRHQPFAIVTVHDNVALAGGKQTLSSHA